MMDVFNQLQGPVSLAFKDVFTSYLNKNLCKEAEVTQEFLDILFQAVNFGTSYNAISTRLFQIMTFEKPEDKDTLQQLLEPLLLSKNVHSLNSNAIEEAIYSHCLYYNQKIDMQQKMSLLLLYKQLYMRLYNLISTVGNTFLEDQQLNNIAQVLLQAKFNYKYLEFVEGSSSVDNEVNNKLLKRLANEPLQNSKEYLWIRNIDKVLHLILSALNYLKSQVLDDHSEC
mmetsp:Transcript_44132/g.42837  ORF Transcript_44132/g.42837 Transcript_44132/m.42837 type:complete len:227 (-) Transcript_44132:2112-2792(-)